MLSRIFWNLSMTSTSHPSFELLQQEHAAVCRNWGAVQERCSRVIAQQSSRIAELESEVAQLRAQPLLVRTQEVWALRHAAAPLRQHPVATAAQAVFRAEWGEANVVLCQVACVSHGGFWLGADGQCQRSAAPCAVHAAEEAVQRISSPGEKEKL